MKFVEIGSHKFGWARFADLHQVVVNPLLGDFYLIDLETTHSEDLLSLLQNIRARKLGYAHAREEHRSFLEAGGHFDLTSFFGRPDLGQLVHQIFEVDNQVQGFSLLPDESARLSDDFPGRVIRHGRYELEALGDFPQETLLIDFQPLVVGWEKDLHRVPFRKFYRGGKFLLTFDYQIQGDLEVVYLISSLDKEGRLLRQERVTGREIVFEAGEGIQYRCQIYLKGSGTVKLGKVWTYSYRYGQGYFLPGDRRTPTRNGEYLHSYFIPGKKRGKLIVGFSGNLSELPQYERQSMAKFDFPLLLFCDLRARGGAFQLGKNLSLTYEVALMQEIDTYLKACGLERSDLIMIGWSMGSFPAIYYGTKMAAGHVITAKPLFRLGQVTSKIQLVFRMETSMISAREYLTGGFHREDNEKLDKLLSDHLSRTDLSQTDFYSFHMQDDELDQCQDFYAEEIAPRAKSWNYVEAAGFHADKIPQMGSWLNQVLKRILSVNEG